ncbi:MAG: hypothetical protein DDT42_01444 [candidate division WS2 bacterium]|uniref:Uncharacterized protein n=1 Tax=Psychracetigena formicireducens TaxID=2986056 RepID=A0A9E2F4Y3_PSYF1|nr:hypothetical protein [Candidatus Psychracetigena formicireducens]MBT9145571.1 hypothetical protein [Candidatus Psychracetigena formicireducens]
MAEWHLPPEYIVSNWTHELLNLMLEKLVNRKNREIRDVETAGSTEQSRTVSDTELFALLGDQIKVVKQ